MRKLTILMATAAFIAVPLAAQAGNYGEKHDQQQMHRTNTSYNDGMHEPTVYNETESFYVTVKSTDNYMFTDGQHQYSFDLTSNEKLLIRGDSAFIVNPNGSRHYAPEGSYYAKSGYVVNVEDGSVYSIEEPAEVAYVEIDATAPDAKIETYKVK